MEINYSREKSLKEAWQVVLYDLGISKVCPPQDKYNASHGLGNFQTYPTIMVDDNFGRIRSSKIRAFHTYHWVCFIFCSPYSASNQSWMEEFSEHYYWV